MNPLHKTMLGVGALGGSLLALSGLFDEAKGFEGTLGDVGWFGFLLSALSLIVLALVALGRTVLRRTSPA